MSVRYLLAPSLVDFRAEVNRLDPGRDKASDGWIGDVDHSSRVSRHNPDGTKPIPLVRAVDIDKDGDEWPDLGNFLAEHLRARKDSRTNVVIWRRRIFSSYANSKRRAWEWGPYSGVNAHLEHLHHDVISGPVGARAGGWGLDFPTSPEPTTPEDFMAALTDVEQRELLTRVRAIPADVWRQSVRDDRVGMSGPVPLILGDVFHHARKGATSTDPDVIAAAVEAAMAKANAARPGSPDVDPKAVAREVVRELLGEVTR